MPAPTPIRIRYGNAGLLGQSVAAAASAEASNANYDRQHASDTALIGQMLNHSNRMQEMQLGSELDAHKLQAAYALQRANNNARQPAPAETYYAGPLAAGGSGDAAAMLKAAMLSNAPVGESGKMSLTNLVNRKDITPEQFRSVVFEAEKTEKNTKDAADRAKSREQKQKYVTAATQGMNEQDAATIGSMVDDDRVSLSQIRVAADTVRQRNTILPRTKLALTSAAIDKQQSLVRQQMDALARALGKADINPEASSPADLNPTYQNPKDLTFKQGFGEAFNPLYDANLVQPGNVAARQAYIAYHRLKRQFNDLAAKREALLTGGSNPSAADPAAGSDSDPLGIR